MPAFDPAALVDSLEKDRLTVLQGVPAMFARLIEHLRVAGLETVPHPALRVLSAGGSPLDPALKADVEAVFGLPLNNGYGLTECAPTIAQSLIENPAGLLGRPDPDRAGSELVGLDGLPVPDGGSASCGSGTDRHEGLLPSAGGNGRGARPPTAGSTPATSRASRTATCSWSAARRS